MSERVVPGALAAAIMTRRSELVRVCEQQIRDNTIQVSQEMAASIVGCMADLIEQMHKQDMQIRSLNLMVKQFEDLSKSMAGFAEKIQRVIDGEEVVGWNATI